VLFITFNCPSTVTVFVYAV